MKKIDEIKGIGPKNKQLLNKLGIETINDLVEYYPFRYEHIKKSNINELVQDDPIVIDGIIETIPNIYFFNRKMNRMTFKLNTGVQILNISIFNRAFLKSNLDIGKQITVIGKYDKLHSSITASDIRFGMIEKEKIEPIYHTVNGITKKQIHSYILQVIDEVKLDDFIPEEYKDKYKLIGKEEAVNIIHKPKENKFLIPAIARLKYEELFLFMLKMNWLKKNRTNKVGIKKEFDFNKIKEFIASLPFELTEDQLRTIEDIKSDMNGSNQMNRLIQGDVGSGKTIVSFIAVLINYLSGYQSALMAPTEILAEQHYMSATKLFKNLDLKIGLLTGKMKAKEKKEIYQKLSSGEIQFIIGTHALFTEDVVYQNLGLVITDEQHRFGVNQRLRLRDKGTYADILYMSATPIPRTYALTVYGDMDVSNIKTLPSNRKKVLTSLKNSKEIKSILESMYEELKQNHQVYVIAPLIEESENSDLENVESLKEKMTKAFGKLYTIGILHGKMKSEEKEQVMNDFKENKIQILISTTVIEVGIDVKNATMIVIFDSFRFGLSALHQLRGRVGRSDLQSYCILISDKETERLKILTKTNDGFEISEEDFRLRGSGDLFGEKQSGDMLFKLADIKKDFKILIRAKEDSEEFLEKICQSNEHNIWVELLDNTMNLG